MSSTARICDSLSKEIADSPVSDEHIAEVVSFFNEWQFIATRSLVDQNDIQDKYPHQPKLQQREALHKWKQTFGSEATYRKLIKALCSQGQVKAAEDLRDPAMNLKENDIIAVSLTFYAGLTNLQIQNVQDFVFNVLPRKIRQLKRFEWFKRAPNTI